MMKYVNMRYKRNSTDLFFDSFKHFKHNLSNLIGIELPTLIHLGAKKYLNTSLISTNYKSKYPDMRKIGLIDYNKPSDYDFVLTKEAKQIINAFDRSSVNVYDENISKSDRKNIDSLSPKDLFLSIVNWKQYKKSILQLILSYYDTADSIRPYLVLLNYMRNYNIKILKKEFLQNILAQTKEDVLLMQYNQDAFKDLNLETQRELNRPVSYIYNFLITALVLDDSHNVIVDFNFVDILNASMNNISYSYHTKNSFRPVGKQQLFREHVLEAYDYKCAITGKSLFIDNRCLLEAAHIIPYRDGGSFAVNNGIALSYEMHKMFDNGLFSFGYENDGEVVIITSSSNRIVDRQGILANLNRKSIFLPEQLDLRPDPLALQYNRDKFLLR
ncbi:HNH endonuclease [Helicobacter pylori]|uniref:HNH endonuclease n=1 Tax=Helicobacter pylori TaxID=210 RepID=UPI00046CA158|nr:HNH endonuclease [Helicobacter pylori]MBH0277714.1 HNH endonuclease [Helicobacter pylori]MBH0280629.1 HNH endonuclease [Helicobacter pylori]MBH0283726.1 HNH endonuclease [Helicobacter pylori]QQW69982.1 HNH endonuclease [Helicobacter pylori]WQS81819.1 HNH endonuclease [Helicobacter pylori]